MPMKDINKLKSGEIVDIPYQTVTGIEVCGGENESSDQEGEETSGSGTEGEEERVKFVDSHRPRDESPDSKKV